MSLREPEPKKASGKASGKGAGKKGAGKKGAAGAKSGVAARLAAIPLRLVLAVMVGAGAAVGVIALLAPGCGWDPRSPFERNAPPVTEALRELDAGRLESAEEALEKYLGTGACGDGGSLAVSDAVRNRPNGSFDLGLTLFNLGERFGERFGDEEAADGGSAADKQKAERRADEINCALPIVRAMASDPTVPTELRARAHYLAGNLEFLRKKYEEAVKDYDEALALTPGLPEDGGGDGIGRDAAWNRAIALRREEDQKDAGNDGGNDGGSDSGDSDGGGDGGGQDAGGDSGGQDSGSDGGGGDDGGKDAGKDSGNKDDEPDAGPPPPPPDASAPKLAQPSEVERLLDQLEQAPTYQEQEAKQRAASRRGRATMEDK